MKFILALTLAVLGACASKDKARPISTNLENAQDVNGQSVGIKDGNIIVQRKVYLSEELRGIQNHVYALEDEIYGNRRYSTLGLYGVYKDCRAKLADKRIGGTGKLNPIEPAERLTQSEPELKIGVDEKDQLVGITEESLRDRVSRFQGYKTILEKRREEYEEKIDLCDNEYKTALIDHGLKPEDTQSKGEWVMGPQGYRIWRATQVSTDDPEELARRKAQAKDVSSP